MRHGFSLVEVLVAMFMFFLAVMGVTALIIRSMHGNSFSHNLTTATYVLENKVDELRGLGASGVTYTSSVTSVSLPGNQTVFGLQVTVDDHPSLAGLKTAISTVCWADSFGRVPANMTDCPSGVFNHRVSTTVVLSP